MATSTFAEIEIPEGGIADFVMSKANLDLLAKEEANKLFGQKALLSFKMLLNVWQNMVAMVTIWLCMLRVVR